MSNKYAEISKVKISTLNKNGKTILDDVYFTSPFKVAPPFYKSDDFIKDETFTDSPCNGEWMLS